LQFPSQAISILFTFDQVKGMRTIDRSAFTCSAGHIRATSFLAPLLGMLLLCGCVATGPAVSKTDVGNLEINVKAPQSVDVRYARIYVDDIFIGNVSATMPVLHLKKGKRLVRVEMDGMKTYRETIEILGEPNHQVLNVMLAQ